MKDNKQETPEVQGADEGLNINEFPVEVLPNVIQEIVISAKDTLNFPVDYTAISILYAVSISMGLTYEIEVKKGYKLTGLLYCMLLGNPGVSKTHPLKRILEPIRDIDRKNNAIYKQELDIYNQEVFEEKKKKIKERRQIKKPIRKQLLLTDATPEAVIDVMSLNDRGIGLYNDELSGWFANFNRYNNGSSMQFWLSVFSSTSHTVNRKTTEDIFIDKLYIPVIGTIQPEALIEAFSKMPNNGFLDRFLTAYPKDAKKEYLNDKEMPRRLLKTWSEVVERIYRVPKEYFEGTFEIAPIPLKLSNEAKPLFKNWQIDNTDLINNTEDSKLQGVYSKAEILVLRLALILEVLSCSCIKKEPKTIQDINMIGAIKLIEHYKLTMKDVNHLIYDKQHLKSLTENKKAIYDSLPDTFKTQECIELFSKNDLSKASADRFMKDKSLFSHVSRGNYKKVG
jgi:hypothetical protein